MKKMIIFYLLTILILLPLQAQTAQKILDDFSLTLAVPEIQGAFHVQLISRKGDVREIEARVYQKLIGTEQNNRLFIFDFPPTVRGTGLLLHSYFDDRENNMWIYLPAVRRIKRIALESSGGGYFMGSDFTYRDLIGNDYNELNFERLEDTVVAGHDCYTIKAWAPTPEARQDHGYSHIINYLRKDTHLLFKRDYFDLSGDLLKVYRIEDFLNLNPYIYPTVITMENVQTGHKSILEVKDISTESIPDRYFTTRFLQNN